MSTTVKVEIRQLPHGAGLALPAYQSAHAAGLDLLAAVPEDTPLTLAPGQHALVPTGLAIALPSGYEAQVRPRSGLAAKHGVTVLNAPGTVDADYRGEIGPDGDRFRHQGGTGSRRLALIHPARHRRLRFDRPLNREKTDSFSPKFALIRFVFAFLCARTAFTIWTLTGRLPLGILSTDSRTAY